jgi:hypothetical protein
LCDAIIFAHGVVLHDGDGKRVHWFDAILQF